MKNLRYIWRIIGGFPTPLWQFVSWEQTFQFDIGEGHWDPAALLHERLPSSVSGDQWSSSQPPEQVQWSIILSNSWTWLFQIQWRAVFRSNCQVVIFQVWSSELWRPKLQNWLACVYHPWEPRWSYWTCMNIMNYFLWSILSGAHTYQDSNFKNFDQ
jgi:hypothetical protein